MTACVNKKHTRRVALAISASLAGALSLGAAAPAVAFAENSISTLAADTESSVEDGTIIEFEDGYEDGATFVADGTAKGLVPTLVQPWATSGTQYDVDSYVVYKLKSEKDGGEKLEDYGRVIDGQPIYIDNTFGTSGKMTDSLPTEIGEYAVFAIIKEGDSTYYRVKEGATFSIVAADLSDAKLFQVNPSDPESIDDTDFVFNTGNWELCYSPTDDYGTFDGYNRLALAIGDEQIEMDELIAGGGSLEYYTAAGKSIKAADIKAAGDYYVVVSAGETSIFRGAKARFDFTIQPLDLATANLTADDVEWDEVGGDTTTKVYFEGAELSTSWLNTYVNVNYPNVALKTGPASATVVTNDQQLADDGFTGSIINSKVVDYNVVNHIVTPTANYGTEEFSTVDLDVNFSMDPTNEFDASKVSVSYADPENPGKTVQTDKYTLRVVNTQTQEVGGAEMLEQKGTYTVQAILDSEALSYEVAGKSGLMDVTVTKGKIGETDIAFVKDDQKIQGSITEEYIPGKNWLDGITVAVKTENGKELDASEYTVTVTDADGNEVTEATEVGTYTMTVTAEGYDLPSGNKLTINIKERDLSDANLKWRVKEAFEYQEWNEADEKYDTKSFIPYTGSVIVPTFEWSVDGETWYELPAADYEATYTIDSKKVELKDVSNAYMAVLEADKDSKNYEGKTEGLALWVSDARVFADVPNNAWYSQYIYTAAHNGYMTGLDGTDVFNPETDITRGDVAVVLWKMAGKPSMDESPYYVEGKGYVSGFGDVEPTMYYAQAVAWAKASGIVTGYDGTDQYRPDAAVSRQELCTMLARYAAKCGEDVAGAEADLSGYTDAAQVAAFAQDAVDYLVSEGVYGQDVAELRPADAITRAEVAAMVVRLDSVVDYTLIPGIER